MKLSHVAVGLLIHIAASASNAQTETEGTITLLDRTTLSVTLFEPAEPPAGWVYLQHGFFRNKSNMAATARALSSGALELESGQRFEFPALRVLTVQVGNMAGGNPSLARRVAERLASGSLDVALTSAPSVTLPDNFVVAGHSAGGLFATYMGDRLVELGASGFQGVVLLDPVDARSAMQNNMQSIIDSGKAVYSVLANASRCNSQNNAVAPLRNVSSPFVGVKLTDNSHHFDAEGKGASGFATLFCSGRLGDKNQNILRTLTQGWANDMLNGTTDPDYYPGGAYLQGIFNSNDGELLKPFPVCGDGVVEGTEECDGSACCTSACTVASAGETCRSAAGECDVAEVCDGVSATCAVDSYVPDQTTCSIGVCLNGVCRDATSGTIVVIDVPNLEGTTGTEQAWQMVVPAGATDVEISLSGGTGDADLHVAKDRIVSTSVYDCRPFETGNNELCAFNGPGEYNILVRAYETFSATQLTASYFLP